MKKIMRLFFSEKNQNLLDTQEQGICKLGKIRSELKLNIFVSIIDF